MSPIPRSNDIVLIASDVMISNFYYAFLFTNLTQYQHVTTANGQERSIATTESTKIRKMRGHVQLDIP